MFSNNLNVQTHVKCNNNDQTSSFCCSSGSGFNASLGAQQVHRKLCLISILQTEFLTECDRKVRNYCDINEQADNKY